MGIHYLSSNNEKCNEGFEVDIYVSAFLCQFFK
jgi:hypothetical protein